MVTKIIKCHQIDQILPLATDYSFPFVVNDCICIVTTVVTGCAGWWAEVVTGRGSCVRGRPRVIARACDEGGVAPAGAGGGAREDYLRRAAGPGYKEINPSDINIQKQI